MFGLMTAALGVLATGMFSLRSAIDAQGASLGARIDAQGARIDAQGESLAARIDGQGASLGARIDAQGARIDELAADMHMEFRAVHDELHELDRRLTGSGR
jgi:hypothetical protein